mmetsp:Transcript_4573/g.8816  ORF Transcript_4573/g.8816 Transcript_4573/m.8816 type:complete len:978 (+) Transcript_4573:228-3161(+)
MMLNPDAIPLSANGTEASPDPNAALRFEDLTIDDDLSLLERVVRYVRSGIALQRLVHVKMIAETAKAVGTESTINAILPLLPPLVSDSESIIRQHLAMQLLPLCLTCMFGDDPAFDPKDKSTVESRVYNDGGYAIATLKIVSYMNTLICDSDMDVRKAASDGLATLALYIRSDDILSVILRIPLQLVRDEKNRKVPKQTNNNSASENISDDLCITACHLLADVASISSSQVTPIMVSQHISPTLIALSRHENFRVRRTVVQALPRVISGSTLDDLTSKLMSCFNQLSTDESYRVRKSVGECLVDLSRSLMLLANNNEYVSVNHNEQKNTDVTMTSAGSKGNSNEELKAAMRRLRRDNLIPICSRLLQDNHKVVKYGMLQFLGPFIASFYPLDSGDDNHSDEGIVSILDNKDDRAVGGMGSQFFPHAYGMVTRLNPEFVSSPTTMLGIIQTQSKERNYHNPDSKEYLQSLLPQFLEKRYNDSKSLVSILRHRERTKIDQDDIAIIKSKILPSYVELASINSGEDNSDAEMRVYCAYSLPAVVLLMGNEEWDRVLKNCFLKLIVGSSENLRNKDGTDVSFVPLPVKRCLASSFHTICHIVGSAAFKATTEEKTNKRDILSIFEHHLLRDQDDTVRLNIIRNLPSFLSLLSSSKRSKYLPPLFDIICGDTMLASKRKNALNPMLLNWRQRDMIAQILPNLICLYRPDQVRQYLWPIIKLLLSDSVNLIRENVEWSIPILLRSYEYNRCVFGREDATAVKLFCQESCNEVFVFLKATLLENRPNSTNKTIACGAFSKRQSYCRILSAMALILRLNEDRGMKRAKAEDGKEKLTFPVHPFYDLTREEYRHIHHLLRTLFLPPALDMKDDKVTNVRLTLAKSLRVMPSDISDRGDVHVILRTLEDEIETWEGGGGQNMQVEAPKIKTGSNMIDVNKGITATTKAATNMKNDGKEILRSLDGLGDVKIPKVGSNEDDSMSLASI